MCQIENRFFWSAPTGLRASASYVRVALLRAFGNHLVDLRGQVDGLALVVRAFLPASSNSMPTRSHAQQ